MRKLLISMVANFLFWWNQANFLKLEPRLLSWLQPRKKNCVPTELDVSISAHEGVGNRKRPLVDKTIFFTLESFGSIPSV